MEYELEKQVEQVELQKISGHPEWLKKVYSETDSSIKVDALVEELNLSTVCMAAECPNRCECYSRSTATFLLMGNTCTRSCGFCVVVQGPTSPLDAYEPERVARAIKRLGLKHAVLTSVTRDDLPDGGAGHFSETISAIKNIAPETTIEVLVPDFRGDQTAIERIISSKPDLINHNMETVPGLYAKVRPEAHFNRSLNLLKHVSEEVPGIITKSGIMLGLGETMGDVVDVLSKLVDVGCSSITIGQYLQPSPSHLQVIRYVQVEEFDRLGELAHKMGFKAVASGPFVRSSYNAAHMLISRQ